MFRWKKLGLIFSPADRHPWMREYAQCPTTLLLDDRIRVYFSTRPQRNPDGSCLSSSAFVDFDRHQPSRIIAVSESPLLPHGGRGEFDEFGSMAGCVVANGGQYHLYYCGWTRMQSVPYNWSIGLATSNDAANFTRYGKGPVIGSTPHEPYLQACPVVKIINHTWHMWYLSGLRWIQCGDKMESVYQIMHASSDNGITWNRDATPIVSQTVEDECQTSASIIEFSGKYHMFFSFRHGRDFRNQERGYRIGYACSDDLVTWKRDDSLAGLTLSNSGWDSEMVCYPHVFKLDDKIMMLYCGNYFGRDGFGLAELIP